jgi:hypothetical protein
MTGKEARIASWPFVSGGENVFMPLHKRHSVVFGLKVSFY